MLGKMRSKKAQAVLEIGLLGSLILIVFSLLIGYIQRLNDDQYVLMNNFRSALKKAHDDNSVVSYTTLEDRRHIDTNSPLQGKRASLSSSNYIHWAVPATGDEPNRGFYYKINEEELVLDEDDAIDDIVFEYDTDSGLRFSKIETSDSIQTIQDVEVNEKLTYVLRNSDEDPIRTIIQDRRTDKRRAWETDDILGLEE